MICYEPIAFTHDGCRIPAHLPDKNVLRKKLQEFIILPSTTIDYTNEDQK